MAKQSGRRRSRAGDPFERIERGAQALAPSEDADSPVPPPARGGRAESPREPWSGPLDGSDRRALTFVDLNR